MKPDLQNITKNAKDMLLKHPKLRNPYQRKAAHWQYWKDYGGTNGIFVTKKQYIDLPSAETLSRCIRKAQKENPDLQSDDDIDRYQEAEQFRLNFRKED